MRATVIRVPDAQPGLVVANDRELQFKLEGTWCSPIAPELNMPVELELDERGVIRRIIPLDKQELQQAISDSRMSVVRSLEERVDALYSATLDILARQHALQQQALWWATFNAVLSGLAARDGVIDSSARAAATEVADDMHGQRGVASAALRASYNAAWPRDLSRPRSAEQALRAGRARLTRGGQK